MSNFNGKVAVVTGGNSGMGLATAKELAAGGAKVVIAGRDRKTLDEAVKEIGNNSFGVKTDVSKLSEIENLFADASKKFGKIDILFVNAGIGNSRRLSKVTKRCSTKLWTSISRVRSLRSNTLCLS